MKTREEFNEEVFARRDAYIKERKQRTKRIISVSASAACVVLVAVVAVAGLGNRDPKKTNVSNSEENGYTLTETEKISAFQSHTSDRANSSALEAPDKMKLVEFSFDEDMESLKPDPNLRTNGFVNTSPEKTETAEDAVNRAKKELNKEFPDTEVAFDYDESVWRVRFGSNDDPDGGCCVYITENGITLAVVYFAVTYGK